MSEQQEILDEKKLTAIYTTIKIMCKNNFKDDEIIKNIIEDFDLKESFIKELIYIMKKNSNLTEDELFGPE